MIVGRGLALKTAKLPPMSQLSRKNPLPQLPMLKRNRRKPRENRRPGWKEFSGRKTRIYTIAVFSSDFQKLDHFCFLAPARGSAPWYLVPVSGCPPKSSRCCTGTPRTTGSWSTASGSSSSNKPGSSGTERGWNLGAKSCSRWTCP